VTEPALLAHRAYRAYRKLSQEQMKATRPISEADLLRCRVPASMAEFQRIQERLAELEEER
jgi:hypothetical protein